MSDLVAAEQKEIVMYGDAVTAVRADDGEIYVALAHMCDALGLDAQGQARRIQRHAVLAEGLGWVAILSTQGDAPAQRRRVQALRADLVPLWLTGVRTSMVAEDIRPKLEQLQRNAARLLWQAFQDGRLTGDVDLDALLQQDTEAVQAYKMLAALTKMARQQVILESRVQSIEARLEDVEAALRPGEAVLTQDEASQIAQAVKGIALVWSKRSGRNEYGAVYGRLYDHFGVTGYKMLPRSRFREALDWLASWRRELQGPPF
jgi:hypothetical protein